MNDYQRAIWRWALGWDNWWHDMRQYTDGWPPWTARTFPC